MRWERIGSKFKFCNKEDTQLNIKAFTASNDFCVEWVD